MCFLQVEKDEERLRRIYKVVICLVQYSMIGNNMMLVTGLLIPCIFFRALMIHMFWRALPHPLRMQQIRSYKTK